MTVTTNYTFLNVLSNYLTTMYFVKIPDDTFQSTILYNPVTFEIMAILPSDFSAELDQLAKICDYISLVADASQKIDHPDQSIGIIYIDTNASEKDSISIARLPYRQKILADERKNFLFDKRNKLPDLYRPFWEVYQQAKPDGASGTTPKDIKKGQILVERAIQKYCDNNSLPRDIIKSVESFIDYVAEDIFRLKFSVADEQQIRAESEKPNELYPETLLKLLVQLGLLE